MGSKRIVWTEEMDKCLLDNFHVIPFEEIAEKLNLNVNTVVSRSKKIVPDLHRQNKTWSDIEVDLLMKYYGNIRDEEISKILKRSVVGIVVKVWKLEGCCDKGMVTGKLKTPDIGSICGVTSRTVSNWVVKGELKALNVNGHFLVDEEYFWKWLKSNLDKIKVVNIENYITQTSPAWYGEYVKSEQRKAYLTNDTKQGLKFSEFEKTLIWDASLKGRNLKQVSSELNRSYQAVRNVLCRMRKERGFKVN